MEYGKDSNCYVTPVNRSAVADPVALEKYMETHPVRIFNMKHYFKIFVQIETLLY